MTAHKYLALGAIVLLTACQPNMNSATRNFANEVMVKCIDHGWNIRHYWQHSKDGDPELVVRCSPSNKMVYIDD